MIAGAASAGVVEIEGKRFTVPDGFTIEKVAGTPLVDRPMVGSFDERGRLYLADSSGSSDKVEKQLADKPHRIVRLEDADGDGAYDKQVVFADKMMFPEGAMWLAGSLYVAAAPSIWKLTDTNGDGVADERVEWFKGKTLTGCANDLHGPYAGPDGRIYWAKGAFAEQRYARQGKPDFVTKAAHLFRARRDGTGVEPVMTGGMDNPIDVAFLPNGERFFTTTFLQWPAGGRRDGIIHAVYGGVWGKLHDVIEGHTRTSPHLMPVMTHLGPAAPSGLHRYESTAFGEEYKDNLFAACFNLRKVTRHAMTPAGASYTTKDSDFVVCDHRDFHPTDVIEDADGSLLVIDTGGWYKLCCPTSQLGKPDVLGAVYRVKKSGATATADPWGTKVDWNGATADSLIELLADNRPAVRSRAVEALASKGGEAVSPLAKAQGPATMRLNRVWTLSRIDSPDARRLIRETLTDQDETVRHAASNAASVWKDRDAVAALTKLLADPSLAVRRAAAEATGRIGDATAATPALLAAVDANGDWVLAHSLTYALIELGDGAALAEALKNSSPKVRKAALTAMDQMPDSPLKPGQVIPALSDPHDPLRETAGWIVGRRAEWGDALASVLKEQLARPEAHPQLGAQLASLSKAPAVQRLIAERLADATTTAGERVLLLGAMQNAGLKNVPDAWVPAVTQSLALADEPSVAAAVRAARALPVRREVAGPTVDALRKVSERTELNAAVRLDALAAIPAKTIDISDATFDFVASQLAPDQPLPRRLAAADAVARSRPDEPRLRKLIPLIHTMGPMELDRMLPAFDVAMKDDLATALVTSLAQAKSARALGADALRRKLPQWPDAVKPRFDELLTTLNPDAGKQKARLEELLATLPKGDVRRGQAIFNSERAACATCHAIGYVGGTLGPDLTRVGSVRQERDLLESVVFPSVSFVQAYEPVVVETRDRDVHAGVLKRDSADEVIIATGPQQEVRIPRRDVRSMRRGDVSVMPEGYDQNLAPQELADLLAFLKVCK